MWQLFIRMAKGAAVVALFSVPAFAQEEVTRGNQRVPVQPPSWFVRMASQPAQFAPELEFAVPDDRKSNSFGKFTSGNGQKYFCGLDKTKDGGLVWRFCDM